ncbi:polyadenylate-binding protein, putative [Theileria equi strain WA]|uniref:Polyadenylate-binding protein n=1 Tax=Theileria equi strain WA TaxID=1537102 RepID=L1LFP0_THEEQ|nr:polyadenylate-binding protein, putative [Theileria equi strain WA]EKX74089.1 polyadenylate-binding protein, putative [Theileria equi strain WA]|eukprot:XP_004833541.1 polyadenylate-binding protein, putative [Theileria equi strain WA]
MAGPHNAVDSSVVVLPQVPGLRDNQQLYNSASLYVGDLQPDVTEAILYEVFNSVGPVSSIRVCRDSITRKSLGYAYVNYYSVQDAEAALESLNYIDIKGHPTRIMWSNKDPTLRKSGAGNIFVKNLDRSIDTKAFYDTFSHFGPILSCKVAMDENGVSKGYGFVHYDTEESAKEAIEKVNGMVIGGKKVEVSPFIKKQDRDPASVDVFTNLYVRNFPVSWDEEALKQFLDKYGEITSMMIKEDGKGRKFAFVNFAEPEMAKEAVEALNGTKLEEGSEPLLVCPHQDKAKRQAFLKSQYISGLDGSIASKASSNLYIKNLDDSFTDESLQELFGQFGSITSCKIMRDASGVSRGFGFVCFSRPEEATKAIAGMHLKIVKGKPLYVGLAEKKEQRLSRLQQSSRSRNGDSMNQGPIPSVLHGVPGYQDASGFYGQGFRGGPQGVGVPGRGVRMYPQSHIPVMPRNMHLSSGSPLPPNNAGLSGMQGSPNLHSGMQGSPSLRSGLQGTPNIHPGIQVTPHGAPNIHPAMPTIPNVIQRRVMPTKNAPVSGFKFTAQARNREVGSTMSMGVPMHPNMGMPTQAPGQQTMQPAMQGNATTHLDDTAFQKQMIGERLFPIVARDNPDLAGKITGMMLEIDNAELLALLEDDARLKAKIDEAIRVLKQAS